MGGGGSAPRQPSPEEMARAQQRAAEEARKRKQAEDNARADAFLSENAIPESFRGQVQDQVFANRDRQLAMLNRQLSNTLDDIRQRQAGRGLGSSGNYSGLQDQANVLAAQSRQDILDNALTTIEDRLAKREGFRQSAARNIRSGADTASATSRFQQDIRDANSAFEKQLANSLNEDQRSIAFQDFEDNRRAAALRFQESVAQNNANSLLANTATLGTQDENEKNAGQLGINAPGLNV